MSLTVVQRVDGVDHQLQEAVPEVAPGVEDLEWDSSRFVLLVALFKFGKVHSRGSPSPLCPAPLRPPPRTWPRPSRPPAWRKENMLSRFLAYARDMRRA